MRLLPSRRVGLSLLLLLCVGAVALVLLGGEPEAEPTLEWAPRVPAGPLSRCEFGESDVPLGAEALAAPGPRAVAELELLFEDASRPTPPNGDFEGAPTRRLPTRLWYPAARAGDEPLPLVVYSHGFSSSHDEAEALGAHLASHGYVVAAPSFPLTRMTAPGGTSSHDLVNQPGDLSFVMDQLLARSAGEDGELAGRIDPERVVAMGTSMGGMTTLLVAYHPRLADPRIRAAVNFAAPGSMFDERFYAHRSVPILAVHGTVDAIVYYESNAVRIHELAAPDATLASFEGGSHGGFISMRMPDFVASIARSFLAPDGAHEDHPDGLICGFIAGRTADEGSFIEALGGAEEGIFVPDEPMPCAPEPLAQVAMTVARQGELSRMAALAFLEAHLSADDARRAGACRFVGDTLGEMPDVEVFSPVVQP